MARPVKSGLDYFPFDVDFFNDDKIEYITARFDEKGELIAIKLLCSIYREGYYTDWNEDKATIFSKRAGRNITPSLANDVVNELVKRGFFDRSIFNSFGILTSRGIQKRFLKAIADRKTVEIVEEFWLIDLPKDTKTTVFVIQNMDNLINPPDNSINPPGNSEKPPGKTQSKVKKSKVNIYPPLSPQRENVDLLFSENPVQEIYDHWNENNIIVHQSLTPEMEKAIARALKDTPLEDIKASIIRYATMLHDEKYDLCSYKWALTTFFGRKKGYKYFLDDGEKWLNYTSKPKARGDPDKNLSLVDQILKSPKVV